MGAGPSGALTGPCRTVTLSNGTLIYDQEYGSAEFEREPVGDGTFRYCYKGVIADGTVVGVSGWEGAKINRSSCGCVVKVFKGSLGTAQSVASDVAALQVAHQDASAFNGVSGLSKTIGFPHPLVTQVRKRAKDKWFLWTGGEEDKRYYVDEFVTLEPYLQGQYEKFTNNTSWSDKTLLLPAVFSHFTYHHSRGQHMITDLQGIRGDEKYLCTDPAVHSVDQKFGGADWGALGMLLFFCAHQCNDQCKHYSSPPEIPVEVRAMAKELMDKCPTMTRPHTSFTFQTKELAENPEVQGFCQGVLCGKVNQRFLRKAREIIANMPSP